MPSSAKIFSIEDLKRVTEESPVRCYDEEAGRQMMAAIDEAKANGDSIGGIVEVIVEGMPVGVGSYVHSNPPSLFVARV